MEQRTQGSERPPPPTGFFARFAVEIGANVELEQAFVRIGLGGGALLVIAAIEASGFGPVPRPVVYLLAAHAALSILFLAYLRRHLEGPPLRRQLLLLLDIVVPLAGIALSGAVGPLFYFLFLFVPIGVGLRYGRSYLHVASIGMLVGLGFMLLFRPPSGLDPWLGAGLLLTQTLIPIHVDRLLTRLDDARERLRTMADEMESMAKRDALTGLPNRRMLFELLEGAIHRAERSRESLAVVYFDLDGFKLVNDQLGHAMGDKLLRKVADLTRTTTRASDTQARLGGDEFVVVLEGTRADEARERVGHAILEGIRAIDSLGGHRIEVGASIGVSEYVPSLSRRPPTPDELIHRADQAMYASKKSGKGKISLSPPAVSASWELPLGARDD